MKFLSGPNQGPTTPLCDGKIQPEIARIDVKVFTKADCNLAWKVFSDWEHWNRFTSAYGRMQWIGEPWETGSRLLIELLYPIPATQNRVITISTPPRCIAWINHVLGYTFEQWVIFDPHPGGGTVVSTWLEFTGKTLTYNGQDVREIIRKFAERWYENFAAACDQEASQRRS